MKTLAKTAKWFKCSIVQWVWGFFTARPLSRKNPKLIEQLNLSAAETMAAPPLQTNHPLSLSPAIVE
eukprot:539945-Amphidinium_carterae.1